MHAGSILEILLPDVLLPLLDVLAEETLQIKYGSYGLREKPRSIRAARRVQRSYHESELGIAASCNSLKRRPVTRLQQEITPRLLDLLIIIPLKC